jgi:hypothetical protein
MIEPIDLNAVLYLEKARFVTGEILHGGWSPSLAEEKRNVARPPPD